MKINLKARLKNPVFLGQLLLSVAAPVGLYYGVSGQDVTTWRTLYDLILAALSNPFVLFTIAVSVWAAVNDPLTKGVIDSQDGLDYDEPKETKGGR